MFFFFSKILGYFAQPFTVICFLLIGSVIVRNAKWKKRLFWTAFIAILFFSNEFIANEAMQAWEIEATPFSEIKKQYEFAIVLTGSTISGLTPKDRVYFHRGADRVTHTVQLYKLGLVRKILISGGVGTIIEHDEPEANKFKKAMVMMGIPDSSILIENQTRNTAESAAAIKPMLDSIHVKASDCVLVTSAFHMRRSLACYHKQGLMVGSFTTDFYSYDSPYYIDAFIIPQVDAMMKWNRLCKEWIGIVAYKFAGYI
jgi:uncharacterized SAM-binding protein YcdF (DUF218 family)